MQWSNKNLDKKLPSIITRLPSIGITKISTIDYLPKMTRLPYIGIRKIRTTDYLA